MKKIVIFSMILIFSLPISQVSLTYNGNASDLNNPLEKLIEYVDRNIEISENQLFIKNKNKILNYISYNIKVSKNH